MIDPTPETTPTRDEAVPTGWKLVPVEPTPEMMDAAIAVVEKPCFPQDIYAAMLASAPAPASGGVDAVLNLYREAVRIDVKMEGPQFMGANSSALKRAWEADRASLSPAATPVSEAGPTGLIAKLRVGAGGDVREASLSRSDVCRLWQYAAIERPSMTVEGFTNLLLNEIDDRAESLSQSTSAGRVGE